MPYIPPGSVLAFYTHLPHQGTSAAKATRTSSPASSSDCGRASAPTGCNSSSSSNCRQLGGRPDRALSPLMWPGCSQDCEEMHLMKGGSPYHIWWATRGSMETTPDVHTRQPVWEPLLAFTPSQPPWVLPGPPALLRSHPAHLQAHTWLSYPEAGVPGPRPPRTAGPHPLPLLQWRIALATRQRQQGILPFLRRGRQQGGPPYAGNPG